LVKSLLGKLGGKGSEVPTLFVDNASAVKIAKNAAFNKRLKHVDLRYYFVRECYPVGRTGVEHIDGLNKIC
jgi:hypothetical protein